MRKILMATVLMSLVSIASAQVTISGKVSEYIDNSKVGAAKATTQLVTEPTSNIAVSARERLADGLTTRAIVETSLSGNTFGGSETRFGDRQATVGLANKFASVDLGRNVHSQFLAVSNNDAFGTLYGSIAGDVHNLRNLRLGDAVFVSVAPAKGTTFSFEQTLNGPANDATVVAGSTRFMGVKATLARFEQGSEKSTVFGASAKLRGVTLSTVYSDDQGVVKSKGASVGVSTNVGLWTPKASYGQTNTDVKAWAVGADYNFSKRTALNVAYRTVDKVGKASDTTGFGLGITHRF